MTENLRGLRKYYGRAIANPPRQGVCHTPLHSEYLREFVLRSLHHLRLNHPSPNLLRLRRRRAVFCMVKI